MTSSFAQALDFLIVWFCIALYVPSHNLDQCGFSLPLENLRLRVGLFSFC